MANTNPETKVQASLAEYAQRAAREIGRWYGALGSWDFYISQKRVPTCQEWLVEHWQRFPATSPDAQRTIEGESVEIVGFLEPPPEVGT